MRKIYFWIALVLLVLVDARLFARIFCDDFSADTSANYINTDTYKSGGSFNISNGVLNVSCGERNTHNVFYKDPLLEVGEYLSVSIPAADDRNIFHNRLTISTTTRGPNTSAEDGMRLRVDNGGICAQVYRDGTGSAYNYPYADTSNALTLYIYRDLETQYQVGCDSGSGINIFGTIDIPQNSGVAAMYVGVEGFSNNDASTFDNLTVANTNTQLTELIKGPYLICPDNKQGMTVHWQLDGTLPCTLQWGLDTTYAEGSIQTKEYGSDSQHKYTITNLKPGFLYYYQVGKGGKTPEQFSGSFRAAPYDFDRNLKFLAYGGTLSNPNGHETVCSEIVNTITGDPDYQSFLLHTGDWASADTESDWATQYFNRSYPNTLVMQSIIPIQGCVGNHEFYNSSAVVYDKYRPYPYPNPDDGKYWSYDYGPAHIVILDTVSYEYPDDYDISPTQLAWLESDLQATNKRWKFLVFHNPGWTAGHSPGYEWQNQNNLNIQTRIQPLCEVYGVDVVFCGHYHYYARFDVNGVQHVITGGGGAPFQPGAGENPPYLVTGPIQEYEFCKVDIQGNRLQFEAVKAQDGTVIDSFIIDHGVSGDVSLNGCVDIDDLLILASGWLSDDSAANVDNSEAADLQDLSILASNYLLECPEIDSLDGIYITELMAWNTVSIKDEDGRFSDWIEIFNENNEPVNLYKWYLTDDSSNLTKWQFPSVEVGAQGYLVVYASGKDQRIAGRELHANFTLAEDGGYLAIVKPDGSKIAWEYSPAYPAQQPDESYGLWMSAD